ncbi:MAG: hypothetical protein NXI24_06810 [bacterium]|nr:hypothetical protein [bacterium]
MQSFRKNAVFNAGFWAAAGLFAALAGFDLYHNPGGNPPVILIVAAVACAVAAFWGRGNLAVRDDDGVQFNMGLFNRKKIKYADIKKIKIESGKYVRFHISGAAVKSIKVSLALVHPDDRESFERMAAEIAPETPA